MQFRYLMRDFMFCAVWRVFDINYLFFFQISNVLSIYFSFDIKLKLIATTAFICFHTVSFTTSISPDIYVGATDLQIGFGDDCHLFWKGEKGYRKNAEFRCGTSKGDPMWIKKSGHRYAIGAGNCPLYWAWNRKKSIKNGEFRCGRPIKDLFYIKPRPNGLWAIGFRNYPLYWKGQKGNIKNAEFRCGRDISDVFWIKGAGCKPTNVQILDTADDAKFDGEELIGVTTAASCSGGEHTLILQQSKGLTEEFTLGTTKSTEVNWQVSASVTVEASAKLFGIGGSVSATVGFASGGATTWRSSREKTTGSTSTTGSGVEISYKTPGAAMVVGFAKRYVFDNSRVPAKVTITCKGGHSFTYSTSFSLKTKTYSQTFYKHYLGEFLPGQCTHSRANCVYNWRFSSYKSVMDARHKFNQCFPAGIGKLTKK